MQIVEIHNKNIIWLTYQQDRFFEKFKEIAKSIEIVRQFCYSKSTIIFKINIVKLINKHPKIKNPSLSLDFSKNCFKLIKQICQESAGEFEQIESLLKIHQYLLHFLTEFIYNLHSHAEVSVMTSLKFYYLFSVYLNVTVHEIYLQECRLNFDPL